MGGGIAWSHVAFMVDIARPTATKNVCSGHHTSSLCLCNPVRNGWHVPLCSKAQTCALRCGRLGSSLQYHGSLAATVSCDNAGGWPEAGSQEVRATLTFNLCRGWLVGHTGECAWRRRWYGPSPATTYAAAAPLFICTIGADGRQRSSQRGAGSSLACGARCIGRRSFGRPFSHRPGIQRRIEAGREQPEGCRVRRGPPSLFFAMVGRGGVGVRRAARARLWGLDRQSLGTNCC